MYLCIILHYEIYIYVYLYRNIVNSFQAVGPPKIWGRLLRKLTWLTTSSCIEFQASFVTSRWEELWSSEFPSGKPCQEGGNNCNCLCTCAEFHSSATKRPPPQGGKFAVTHPFTWKITWICWRCDNLPGTNGLGYHPPNLNLFYKLDEGYKSTCYWPLTAKDSPQSSVASSWKLWIKSTSSTWLWHYGYSQVGIIVKISGSGWAVESATRSTT